jgi:hypothetical protein
MVENFRFSWVRDLNVSCHIMAKIMLIVKLAGTKDDRPAEELVTVQFQLYGGSAMSLRTWVS